MGKKSGFTLAEIIITLTIVGVIAAMTIPDMVTNIQDQQYRMAWKKTYADLEGVMRLALSNTGGSYKNVCPLYDHDCLKNFFQPYFNYIQACTKNTSAGKCWHGDNEAFFLNKNKAAGWGNGSGFVLDNGILLFLTQLDPACELSSAGNHKLCAYAYVDINGFNNPNTVGRDIYHLYILEDRIAPAGIVGDNQQSTCASNSTGLGCAALYLRQ